MINLELSSLPLHALASLLRVLLSLGISLSFALPCGLWAAGNKTFGRLLSPLSYVLYPVPKIALLPAFIVLLGLGEASKQALLVSILFFPFFLAIRDGISDIPEDVLVSARLLGLKGRSLFREVYWPALLPRLFSSLRLGLGIAVSVLFFAENYATEYGLGSFIMTQWSMLKYTDMTWGILVLSLLGLGLFCLCDYLEYRYCPWQRKKAGSKKN